LTAIIAWSDEAEDDSEATDDAWHDEHVQNMARPGPKITIFEELHEQEAPLCPAKSGCEKHQDRDIHAHIAGAVRATSLVAID
jgi:hypothetical protein